MMNMFLTLIFCAAMLLPLIVVGSSALAATSNDDVQLKAGNMKYPYTPPTENALAEAMIDSKNITFSNKPHAAGDASELRSTGALATIAISIAAGNRDEQYISRYVESIQRMLSSPIHMPNMHGGLDARGQSPMLFAMAMLWNDKEVMGRFTEDEISKLNTFLKASLISALFTLNDYDENSDARSADRIAVNGDPNCWTGGNINYSEPNCTTLYSTLIMLGLENARAFLDEFSFDALVEELNDRGLTSVYDSFVATYTFEALAQAANQDTLVYKASVMERVVKSKKWSFKGVSIDEVLADPMKLYATTQIDFMWIHIAEDGDYMGQKGMALEFYSTDAAGIRESVNYVTFGIDPCLLNRILLDYYGYFNSVENKAIAEEIDSLQKIGISDYYAKAVNGYYSQSGLGTKTEYPMDKSIFKYVKETMITLGFANVAVFHDTFNYMNVSQMNNWRLNEDEWEVSKKTIIPYNTKDVPNGLGAAFDPDERVITVHAEAGSSIAYTSKEFENINYSVWVSQAREGEAGIIGRVNDADNYYLLSYVESKLAIKKVVDGTIITLTEKEETLLEGAHRFRGVFVDDMIEFYVDGVKVLTSTDSTFARGAVGLFAAETVANFDGVLVQVTKPKTQEL